MADAALFKNLNLIFVIIKGEIFEQIKENVLGVIVYWTIIRTAVAIAAVWLLKSQIDEQLWYIITVAISYAVVIHPAIAGFRKFESKNKSVTESTICASCKHFDESAVLCMKHDKHPTENYIPCDGIHWEPK